MSNRPQALEGPVPGGAAGLDYAALLDEGMGLVQRLTGRTWTNHNWSDPGVTILQQLCYALTELAYRSGFPVADLLGDPVTGRVDLRRQTLHPARAIMSVNPVTADDFRRLIVDRVADVGNAWFARVPADGAGRVDGLYRVQVLVPALDPCCENVGPDPDLVRRDVLDAFTAHRALCEDVDEVVILRPIRTPVAATVQLDDGADPDRVLADLLFRLRLALAPEPERRSLDQLRAAGLTTAEIFDGPLMLRGFVPDDQLPPLPDRVPVDRLLELMAEVPGVLSVERLCVEVDGVNHRPGGIIQVPRDHVLLIDDDARRSARTIVLRHGARVCPVDPARVRRRLGRLWADRRRVFDLRAECARDLPVPNGRPIDLSAYTSVQDQFPAVYGIGGEGPSTHSTGARQAMANQLKGYLMVYDQLMADFVAQLASVRDLFSVEAGGAVTYATQSLRRIVAGAAPLLSPDYDQGLRALADRFDPVLARQGALLDLLLSLYAEQLSLPADAACGGSSPLPDERLIAAKRALLARIVPATRDRGRGFDYRAAWSDETAGRDAIRARIELALLDAAGRHGGAVAVDDAATASFGRLLPPDLGSVAATTFLRVDPTDAVDDADDDASPLAGHTICAALLPALAEADRYRVGALPAHASVHLVCVDLEGRCWALGELRDLTQALALARRLIRAAGERTDLAIVEWTLLRFAEDDEHHAASTDAPPPGADARSRYSFRVSAVMPAGCCDDDEGRRQRAIAVVRANMPAQVSVDALFLHARAMRHFRRLDAAWRGALRDGDPRARARACRHLEQFLHRQHHAPSRDDGGTDLEHHAAE